MIHLITLIKFEFKNKPKLIGYGLITLLSRYFYAT
jgi:hypothetical protein